MIFLPFVLGGALVERDQSDRRCQTEEQLSGLPSQETGHLISLSRPSTPLSSPPHPPFHPPLFLSSVVAVDGSNIPDATVTLRDSHTLWLNSRVHF